MFCSDEGACVRLGNTPASPIDGAWQGRLSLLTAVRTWCCGAC